MDKLLKSVGVRDQSAIEGTGSKDGGREWLAKLAYAMLLLVLLRSPVAGRAFELLFVRLPRSLIPSALVSRLMATARDHIESERSTRTGLRKRDYVKSLLGLGVVNEGKMLGRT